MDGGFTPFTQGAKRVWKYTRRLHSFNKQVVAWRCLRVSQRRGHNVITAGDVALALKEHRRPAPRIR